MTLTILSKILSSLSILLFLLCMLAPLRKSAAAAKYKVIRTVLKPHTAYAILLLFTALIHGILAGKNAGMISGKIAWMLTLLLVIASFAGCKLKKKTWIQLHRLLSVAVCALIIIHIAVVIIR